MHDPHEHHMSALRHIIGYIEGTNSHGLQIFKSKFTTPRHTPMQIGQGAPIHDGLHPTMLFTSVTICSHGHQSVNKQYRGPVHKQNTRE